MSACQQFPASAFNFYRNVQDHELVLYHEGDTRCLHVGGKDSPDYDAVGAEGARRCQ